MVYRPVGTKHCGLDQFHGNMEVHILRWRVFAVSTPFLEDINVDLENSRMDRGKSKCNNKRLR